MPARVVRMADWIASVGGPIRGDIRAPGDKSVSHRAIMLAAIAGHVIISRVPVILHTPLMSVTNAISGIILVGALLQVGQPDKSIWISVLAFVGILVASINVFGGFTVTGRMLEMFKREDAA